MLQRDIINVYFTTQHKGRDVIGPPHRKTNNHQLGTNYHLLELKVFFPFVSSNLLAKWNNHNFTTSLNGKGYLFLLMSYHVSQDFYVRKGVGRKVAHFIKVI